MSGADRRRALFVVNPALLGTGSDFGGRLIALAEQLGWDGMVLETSAGLNVEAIGAALSRREFHLVLAAGGDGTVAEVMAAAHQQDVPMGIVPRGTANIVARELGLPASWKKATRRALERFPSTRAVDLVRVNDGYSALAVDLLSPEGGTDKVSDPPSALSAAPVERLVGDERKHPEIWRRHPDSNRGIRVLQTLALPLGYAASKDLWGGDL